MVYQKSTKSIRLFTHRRASLKRWIWEAGIAATQPIAAQDG
jgi:hypothetical protein